MVGLLARTSARIELLRALGRHDAVRGLKLTECVKVTPQSVVYAGHLRDQPVIVKQARGPNAPELAAAQAEELKFQHPRMKSGPFRVPEPLFWNPDRGVVVMTRAPGIRFDKAIIAAPERRNALIMAAARWMAHYIAPRRETDAFGGGYWIKRRASGLAALPDGADRVRGDRLIAIMRAERAEISGRFVTRARSHGDFAAINLLVDGDDIWGVDINNAHWLAVAKDIARFLVYLEITLPSGQGDGPMGLARSDYEAFFAADGLISEDEADMVLPFFLASEIAGRLLSERANAYVLSATERLADRMIAAYG